MVVLQYMTTLWSKWLPEPRLQNCLSLMSLKTNNLLICQQLLYCGQGHNIAGAHPVNNSGTKHIGPTRILVNTEWQFIVTGPPTGMLL